ncbi:hypothetical protein LINGRAHAP2_LOCUS28988 [Linum grandiflorum]
MDASPIELVVHHGGKLIFSSRGPEYHGRTAIDITLEADNLSYESILKIGLDDLKYQSVERMFFLPHGHSLADSLHPLHSEADAIQLGEDAKFGVVTLYLEATFCEVVVGDNEDDISEGNPEYDSSNAEGDDVNFGIRVDVGVVHLIDDSDRTSDPEFMQAMTDLWIVQLKFDQIQLLSRMKCNSDITASASRSSLRSANSYSDSESNSSAHLKNWQSPVLSCQYRQR